MGFSNLESTTVKVMSRTITALLVAEPSQCALEWPVEYDNIPEYNIANSEN